MTRYEINRILAIRSLEEHDTLEELLEDVENYVLYDANSIRDAVEQIIKENYKVELPEELAEYFDMDRYVKDYTAYDTWYETQHGVLVKLD